MGRNEGHVQRVNSDAEAVWSAYYERLRVLFQNFAGAADAEAETHFKAGMARARNTRDRALAILQENQK